MMNPADIATVVTIIGGLIAIYGFFFGQKPLLDVLKRIQSKFKHKETPPIEKGAARAMPESNQSLVIIATDTRGLMRFNQYVEEVKRLVRQSKYKRAVLSARKARDEIATVGDQGNPDIRLVLGELDVWYAHALMYTGDTTVALKMLTQIIDTLGNQREQYKDEAFVRWCLVLGRAHNHIGFVKWRDLGHYETALDEFRNALPYFVKGGLEEELATDYDNMGRVYAQLGYQTRAKILIEHGKELRRRLPDRYRLALSLNSNAVAHLNFGQPDRALSVIEEALMILGSQVEEQVPRGRGLALLTKARALRHIGTVQQRVEENLRILDEAIKTLLEAESIFQEVSEDVRHFQIYNELGCTYRNKAILLKQEGDTESALRQAGIAVDYLKESIEAAKGEHTEFKYPVYYVDACEDLAQVYYIIGNHREASKWMENAEEAIPPIYKLGDGFYPEQILPVDCFEDYWQQLGKIALLRGRTEFSRAQLARGVRLSPKTLRKAIRQYTLAAAYFGRFLERPIGKEHTYLYPSSRPQLANHRKFVEQVYDNFKDINREDLKYIQDDLLPKLKDTFGIKQSWTEDLLDEPLGFALQMMNVSTT